LCLILGFFEKLTVAKMQYPQASGIGRHSVLRHLREHVLLPNVRMASITRSLIALAETLRCTLHQVILVSGQLYVRVCMRVFEQN